MRCRRSDGDGHDGSAQGGKLIDPQRDRALRMQHAETMRKADEHAVAQRGHHAPPSTAEDAGGHAVDRPSTVAATKTKTMRVIASPSPEGPRQNGRGG